MKRCNDCGEEKSLDQFYRRKDRGPDGRRPYCIPCTSARSAKTHSTYVACREKARGHWRKRAYGITPEEYREMVASQNGTCAICGGPQVGGKALAVDHDHSTGAVRKLLCNSCNGGLGLFKDNPGLLDRAAEYLRQHLI